MCILPRNRACPPKDNANGRSVPLVHQFTGIVVDIHLHLLQVLMCQFSHFQVDENETFQDVIVGHQVDEEVLPIQGKTLLSCHEGEALAQLQNEVLKMVDQRLLQLTLIYMGIRLNLQKLHHIGIFNDFLIFRLWFCLLDLRSHQGLVLTGQDTLIVHGLICCSSCRTLHADLAHSSA